MLTNLKFRHPKIEPLGATWDGEGTNFAIFSENATGVELCLFDQEDQETRLPLVERENQIWYRYVPGVKPGQKYGFRVYGPYKPEEGHRFNPAKLLLDPYAKAIAGDVIHSSAIFSEKDGKISDTDDSHLIPKAIVIDPSFNWEGDQLLQIPGNETIIYETHVKGFTKQHPDIPENLRGTYAGLAHPVAIKYLKSLGITAVELLPVYHFNLYSGKLAELGLRNYWGYDPIGYFAPYSEYNSSGNLGQQVTEFKQMVKSLHAAGIEVILDVVYNHTGEGNESGPTLSLRGIDNKVYYRLKEDNFAEYEDFTGCGNSLNVSHRQVLKMIMDSLRYWVTEMHVDGFRFDLATTLARELFSSEYQIDFAILHGFSGKTKTKSETISERVSQILYDLGAGFFDLIHQDPVISQVKLIAEAWDIGKNDSYQVGNFPVLWSEWNDKYRDTMRKFWRDREENIKLGEFATRFAGSSDLYKNKNKSPNASINYITCHDGFTLNDLVSYNDKHNEANQEDNKDGMDNNYSCNCGVEGKTDNPEFLKLRERQKRNLLTTLMLSHGVPMLLGGDEIGRTQQGDHNAYCQDNEISWFNWELLEKNRELHQFVCQLIQFRQQHPVFRRRNWFEGEPFWGESEKKDILWLKPDSSEIQKHSHEWDQHPLAISIFLNGEEIPPLYPQGDHVHDNSFILLVNVHNEQIEFTLPTDLPIKRWKVVINTTESCFVEASQFYEGGQKIAVTERSLMLLSS